MAHKFDPKNKQKLDNEWRRKNLPPAEVLQQMGLDSKDIVADIGCGLGYFTLSAASINSPNTVYALDTSDELLQELNDRVFAAGLNNISVVKTNEYDFKLPNESVNFALLILVLHEIDDKMIFMKEIKRILKPKGKIAIIEWQMGKLEMGPPDDHRISKEEIMLLLKDIDCEVVLEKEFADFFGGIVAQKK